MEDIIASLQKIQTHGSFWAKRSVSIDQLQLEIKGFGQLKLPLSARNSNNLIKHAKPAKFGWRDQTILDEKVRHAWEIPNNKIKIDRSWKQVFNSLLNLLKVDLGLPESALLKADLHNLLIYEPGQFFAPHQDSEMDRWYHRAAIILWRKQDHYPMLFIIDPNHVIKQLQKLSQKRAYVKQVHEIITSLLPYWSCLRGNREPSLIAALFKLALYINDSQLAKAIIEHFDIEVLSPKTASIIPSLQKAYGSSWCLDTFKLWTSSKNHWNSPTQCENLFQTIVNLSSNNDHHQPLTDWLLTYQLQQIKGNNKDCKQSMSRVELLKGTAERINEIIDFINACDVVNNTVMQIAGINYIITESELYPALDLINVLNCFKGKDDLKQRQYPKLFNYILESLEKEHNRGLRHEDDWSIKEKLPCNCQDCAVLTEFLYSSDQRNKIWPLNQDRRAHIHGIIDDLGIAVTHQTERTGSPHKLILTKTDKLHHQAKRRFERIKRELSSLKINFSFTSLRTAK
ncbi:MAG: hypothetical protein H0U71_01780 [Gammaproteobacteria bacterium]|nr:hypothetical protein [Gammaproteobacteria bacterium]